MSTSRQILSGAAMLAAAVLSAAGAARAAGPPGAGDAAAFRGENELAMNRMMARMAVPPSGDVDQDFFRMMVPHHQGAIDMAKAELRHGRNPRLRRLAQEITVEQQQEIAAMYMAVGLPPPSPEPEPQRSGPAEPDSPPLIHLHPGAHGAAQQEPR